MGATLPTWEIGWNEQVSRFLLDRQQALIVKN